MADTEDVAKVLYQWVTGNKYEATGYLDDLRPKELVNCLEELSIRYRIGIEDARNLLWLKEHEVPQ